MCQVGELGSTDQKLVLQLVLHASDVSNPAKRFATYMRWTDRVVEEFFGEGDKARARTALHNTVTSPRRRS